MPMRIQKIERDKTLSVERIHHAKTYKLTVDRTLCVGCELCSLTCPKEAIKTVKQVKKEGQRAQKPIIDVDENKCHYCGMCTAICPYGALQVTVEGKTVASVVDKQSFPQLIRQITIDTSRCPTGCVACEKACPLGIIEVTSNPVNGNVSVSLKQEQCPCCRVCEVECPEDAIHVRRILTGTLRINQGKCPQGCHDCVDVCPITGALYVSEEDGKVHVNEPICTFCGVCRVVCPEAGAIELTRSTIRHTPVRSGAWNKALEKLTSTTEMTKELRAKGKALTMQAVKMRFEPRKKRDV
jgi:4Fe-4S ferredoxin